MYSFSYLEPVCFSMSSSICCFLICIHISQEAGQVVWYSHLLKNCPQCVVIHNSVLLTIHKMDDFSFGSCHIKKQRHNTARCSLFLHSFFFFSVFPSIHSFPKFYGLLPGTYYFIHWEYSDEPEWHTECSNNGLGPPDTQSLPLMVAKLLYERYCFRLWVLTFEFA